MIDETDYFAHPSPAAGRDALRRFNEAMDKVRVYVDSLTELTEKERQAMLRAPILAGPVGRAPKAFYEEAMRREQERSQIR